MDESANKGLELNCRDAEIRKSSISRIAVEGYDTSLGREDVDGALREQFASCGNIIHVYVPINDESGIICSVSLIYVNQEDEEKVLRLDGSDMGGRILRINPYPFHENHLEEVLAPMKEDQVFRPQRTMMVTGCDTSLPYDVIETELEKYFSAKGSFVYREVTASGAIIRLAYVYVGGQEGVETALERSGQSVGGLHFVVTRVVPLQKKTIPTGYLPTFTHKNKTETTEGNQKKKKKKKSKTREGSQKKKKKSRTREGNQKKKSETRDGNQKIKGVVISF